MIGAAALSGVGASQGAGTAGEDRLGSGWVHVVCVCVCQDRQMGEGASMGHQGQARRRSGKVGGGDGRNCKSVLQQFLERACTCKAS